MAGYGTAPRKVNGVWVTRKGRRLSDKGQVYWEKKHRSGFVDTTGHTNRSRVVEGPSKGMVQKGNIDLAGRRKALTHNPDGSISSVKSIGITEGKKQIDIPTVIPNPKKPGTYRIGTTAEAIAHYKKTGQHLGIFKTQAEADTYAEKLHENLARDVFRKPPRPARPHEEFRPASAKEKKPGFSEFVKASHGDKQAAAQVKTYYSHERQRKQAKAQSEKATDKALFGAAAPAVRKSAAATPSAGKVGKHVAKGFATDIRDTVSGLLPGTAEIAKGAGEDVYAAGRHKDLSFKHTRKNAVAMAKGYKQALSDPYNHPGNFALALLPGYGAAGKVALGVDTARAAEGGTLARLGAGAKAAVKPTPRQLRTVKIGGKRIDVPENATASDAAAIKKAGKPVEIARFSSGNYLTHKILTKRDETLMKRVAAGDKVPGAHLNTTSPVAAVGRELARQRHGREVRAMAPTHAFERFARGKHKLSAPEAKAVEIIARAQTPETFLKAHMNAREKAIQGFQGAGITAMQHIATSTAHHGMHAELSQKAAALVRNPTPKMQTVLSEARALVQKREQDLGMGPAEIAHSIGKAHDEVAAMAEGRQSIAQNIRDLEIRLDTAHQKAMKLQSAHDRATSKAAAAEGSQLPGTKVALSTKQVDAAWAKVNDLNDRLAKTHQKAVDIGTKAQENGAFYLPFKTTHPLRQIPATSRSASGLGPPKMPKVKPLTGAAFRGGHYRTDVVRLLADASREGARVKLAREYWPKILAQSHKTEADAGGAKYAVPMRVTTDIPDEYRQAVHRANRADLTEQEAADANHAKAVKLQEWQFPSRDAVDPATNRLRGTGEQVRWVDRRLIGGLLVKGRPGTVTVGGKDISLGGTFDTLNAVPKILTLAKPGYALNRVQQAVQNLSQQGVFMRSNGKFVEALHEDLNPSEIYDLQALAGVGRSRTLSPEAGLGKQFVTRTAEFMGRHTDDASRMLALVHELRAHGYDTTAKVRAALHGGEKTQVKLDAIATKVNQEAIPFGKLSQAEQRTISRVLFFYPWTRAAVEWTARFPFEHPYQAALAANVGQQGEAVTRRAFGNVPSWAKPLIPVGGSKAEPYTVNLSNISTPQTIVDTGELAQSLATKSNPYDGSLSTPAGQLGPGGAALYGLLSGTDRGKGTYAPLEAAGRAALSSIPELQMTQRLHKPAGSVYPGGVLPAVGTPFGGGFPRKTNVAALNKTAGGGSAPKNTAATATGKIRDLGIGTSLPAPVKKSYARLNERDQAWKDATHGKKAGTRDYYVSKYQADLELAKKWGYLSAAQVGRAHEWMKNAPVDDIRKAHSALSDQGGIYDKEFTPARETEKWLDAQEAYKADLDNAVKKGILSEAQAKRARVWARSAQHGDIDKARVALERKNPALVG